MRMRQSIYLSASTGFLTIHLTFLQHDNSFILTRLVSDPGFLLDLNMKLQYLRTTFWYQRHALHAKTWLEMYCYKTGTHLGVK